MNVKSLLLWFKVQGRDRHLWCADRELLTRVGSSFFVLIGLFVYEAYHNRLT